MRLCLLISLIILTGCTSDSSFLQFREAPLTVLIYADDGGPVEGAVIGIDGKTGGKTNSRGQYIVPVLSAGLHRIVIKKEGFEDLELDYEFSSRTQVLCGRMISPHSLLTSAEEALRSGDIHRAEEEIGRCSVIDPDNPVVLFLRALIDLRRDRYASARSSLLLLLDAGYSGTAVSALLAEADRRDLPGSEQ